MTRSIRIVLLVLLVALLLPSAAFAQAPVVRAVLFYSTSCGHCQYVIEEILPPLFEVHGDQLQMIGIDIGTEEGSALYGAAIDAMSIPEDYRGVPTLIVGDRVLVGSADIPDLFPGLIEEGLAQGGIDWPAIPGLSEVIAEYEATAENPDATPENPQATPGNPQPTAQSIEVPEHEPITVPERVQQDLVGNLLSIVVLIGMVVSLIAVLARWMLPPPVREAPLTSWLVPPLALLGMGVAIYLTIIELSGDPAVCGPVGDCNAVQQSPYAFLFGLIPVGALGIIGCAAIILTWVAAHYLAGRPHDLAVMVLFGLTVIGTGFSIYLTFLEPFVIGATCAWCLSSAVLQTLMLWLALEPARAAFARCQEPARRKKPSRKAV